MNAQDTITKHEAVQFFMKKINEEIKKHIDNPETVKVLKNLGKKVLVGMIPCEGQRMPKG